LIALFKGPHGARFSGHTTRRHSDGTTDTRGDMAPVGPADDATLTAILNFGVMQAAATT
jgi:hypothetical protein